ncbi:MAG: hypothetical protein GDA53_05775 [Rhodobacteraceae bacterium]|nr:hypothetical protein [Paracoccaceae bacterium]
MKAREDYYNGLLVLEAGGTDSDDRGTGFEGAHRLYGGAGNDRLDGYTGNDMLYGGSGKDALYGEGATTR